jgi:acid phosphatase family membrane protein YuiD
MTEAIKAFFDALAVAQRDGWGALFVLWVFVLVVLAAAWFAIRAYRGANDNRLSELKDRLDDCERKHDKQIQAHAKLQRKLAMVTGMLVSQLGNARLPEGFLQMILNDDIEEVPTLGSAAPG